MSTIIRLYGRRGCSLCDTTEALVRPLLHPGEQLVLVDIDADPILAARYLLEIPAVTYGARELPLAVSAYSIRVFLDDCRATGVEVDAEGHDADPVLMTTPAGDRS